jgi:hypothetical protein
MFQNKVNRNYTTGFPGEFQADGPHRGRTARIVSPTIGADPGVSTNRISRAFGYSGEIGPEGSTYSNSEHLVSVGSPRFFGILGNPKRYALQGNANAGSLAPALDLPLGEVGEFYDMATGFIAELFNETTAAKTMSYGDGVAYVPNNISAANNPEALPYGALVSVLTGQAAPTGFVLIPNARVVNTSSLAASALGALVSSYTVIQLTQ